MRRGGPGHCRSSDGLDYEAPTSEQKYTVANSSSMMPPCQQSCGGVDIPYPFGIGNSCFRQGFEVACVKNTNGSAGRDILVLATTDQTIRVLELSVSPFPEARVLGVSLDNQTHSPNPHPCDWVGYGQASPYPSPNPHPCDWVGSLGAFVLSMLALLTSRAFHAPISALLVRIYGRRRLRRRRRRRLCRRRRRLTAGACFNSTGDVTGSYTGDVNFNPEGVYRISNTQNELFVLGCNTFIYAKGVRWHVGRFGYAYYAGCVAVTNGTNGTKDGACAGVGCCHVDIPPGFTDTTMSMSTGGYWSHANQEFCPCDYAFIVEKGNYSFKASDLLSTHIPSNQTMPLRVDWTMPLRLDWAIRDNGSMTAISCAQAPNKPEHEYACRSNNSECVDSTNGPGYFCNCKQGYQGNPYVVGGCTILEAQGITIYTKRELKKITNGYSKHLGGGYFGNVYEGKIDGSEPRKVAVKCSVATRVGHPWKKLIQPPHVPQQGLDEDGHHGSFINEIKFQFDVRHKNIVQLLGCCLETNIPILVFDFVTNGSLDDALHSSRRSGCLSLLERLDIAIGSAEAIPYMHSLDSQKHVHGDIKPSNILLDDSLNPKVSDFGSSKLLSVDSYYVRAVAGDTGYMDPFYIKTQHFTLECDVYSFGVVLLELITRKRARYQDQDGVEKILSMEFVTCLNDEGSGRTMYDEKIYSSGEDAQSQRNTQCLDKIGMLAVRCLKEDKRERPTMEKVVEELMQVKVIACSQAEFESKER
nr:unnamed protein product [Digitaria exilis]